MKVQKRFLFLTRNQYQPEVTIFFTKIPQKLESDENS